MSEKGRSTLLWWVSALVLVAEALLVYSGVLGLRAALIVAVVAEVSLALVAVVVARTAWRRYRDQRTASASRRAALVTGFEATVPRALVAIARHEAYLFVALWRAVRRRPDVPTGAVPVPYGWQLRTLTTALCVVGLAEVVVVHLVLPWFWPRVILLVLSVYGLLWLLGLRAAFGVRPHAIGPEVARLRFGYWSDVEFALADVESASAVDSGRANSRTVDVDGDVLVLSVMGGTTVTVRLRDKAPVTVNRDRVEYVREVRFHADEPAAAVAALRPAKERSFSR